MTPARQVSELAASSLSPNRQFDGVRFINELMPVVAEVREFRCSFAGERSLRFQISNQPPWVVEIERARSKLRMLCARLSVLCNETGDQDVSIYGGEGRISEKAIENSRVAWAKEISSRLEMADVPISVPRSTPSETVTAPRRCDEWFVRFKNTMHEQEFVIQAL